MLNRYPTRIFFVSTVSILILTLVLSANVERAFSQSREELESEIAEIEREIDQLDGELGQVKQKSRTLETAINQLNGEIRRSELTIQGLNLSIRKTEGQINAHQVSIDQTQAGIDKQRSSLAEFLRVVYKKSDRTMVENLLTKDLAEFFHEMSVIEGLQKDAQIALENLKVLKAELEAEQEKLREQKEEFAGLKGLAEVEKQNLASQKSQKSGLLTESRGQEARYQQIIAKKQRDLTALRRELASLSRIGISAENAVQAAEFAAGRVGIRTAFLLGLLEVETGRRFAEGVITAGANTGTGNWRVDMHPTRDVPVFLALTSKLGINPDSVKVSRKPSYGWGGAMGPAQFIPSTWVLYEDRVASITGHNPPNPWDLIDSFTAAAVYLADFGAAQKTPAAEARAARAYISGRPSCSSSICNWYAREVLRLAGLIEQSL